MSRLAILATAGLFTAAAAAQEMPGMPAATSPSPQVLIPRIQVRGYAFENDQFLLEQNIRLEYGLVRDLSISGDISLFEADFDAPMPTGGEFGTGDADLLLEYRFLREDLNAIDTIRASVFAGAELPTASAGFGTDSLDPCFGAVLTAIWGRHGVDAAARYTVVTGEGVADPFFISDGGDDFVNLDAGYAFRLHPEEYGEVRVPAWYLTAEVNSVWTTGGEHTVVLSPGLLIEAPDYAFEFGCMIPLSEEMDRAPSLDFGFLVGLRLLF